MKFDLEVPFDIDASISGRTYYLDISFTGANHPDNLGSNLPLGSAYPVYQSGFDSSATFTLMSKKIRIMN
jgi:hypothetical protein